MGLTTDNGRSQFAITDLTHAASKLTLRAFNIQEQK